MRGEDSASTLDAVLSQGPRTPVPEAWARTWFGGDAPGAAGVISPVRRRRRPWYAKRGPVAAILAAAAISLGLISTGGALPGSPGDAPGGAVAGPVTVGGLEVVVRDVSCGRDSVGDGPPLFAAGHFCLVEVSVRALGRTSRLSAHDQFVVDAEERRYPGDEMISVRANGSESLFEPIAAGRTRQGVVAFDLPGGIEPVRLELRASPDGRPVPVGLD